jgi:hypothetical protein
MACYWCVVPYIGLRFCDSEPDQFALNFRRECSFFDVFYKLVNIGKSVLFSET